VRLGKRTSVGKHGLEEVRDPPPPDFLGLIANPEGEVRDSPANWSR
jgi:hypothetical protein